MSSRSCLYRSRPLTDLGLHLTDLVLHLIDLVLHLTDLRLHLKVNFKLNKWAEVNDVIGELPLVHAILLKGLNQKQTRRGKQNCEFFVVNSVHRNFVCHEILANLIEDMKKTTI